MATLDGFAPYPINLSAKNSVDAIHRAHVLPETLSHYSFVAVTDTPPAYGDVKTSCEFWVNSETGKVYRSCVNHEEEIIIWFEV